MDEKIKDLVGKRFMLDGVIYTVYGVENTHLFAQQGNTLRVNENGEVINPKRFSFEEVKDNFLSPGRPSKGITKKVSLTLQSQLWEEIREIKEEEEVSQSQVIREIIEEFFGKYKDLVTDEEKEQNYNVFKEAALNTDTKRMRFHIHKYGFNLDVPVNSVYANGDYTVVVLEGGSFNTYQKDYIIKCGKLGDTEIEFESCFSIYNEAGEHLGYLYTI